MFLVEERHKEIAEKFPGAELIGRGGGRGGVGHRRGAGPSDLSHVGDRRRLARDRPLRESLLVHGGLRLRAGRGQKLSQGDPPTAVLPGADQRRR